MTSARDDAQRFLISRRGFVGGAAAAAAALAIGAEADAAPAGRVATRALAQDGGSTVIIATLGEASSINPFLTNESEGDWRCRMLFDRFVRIDPTSYASIPGLAESWTIEDLVITFKIRANATFSDGTDLTADDVAFTIAGHINPKTGSSRQSKFLVIAGAQDYADGKADSVSGLEVVDPKTLKVTLAQPDAPFLLNLRYIYTVPKAALDGKDLATDALVPGPGRRRSVRLQ